MAPAATTVTETSDLSWEEMKSMDIHAMLQRSAAAVDAIGDKISPSLHRMSIHGTFSTKITATDKQKTLEEKKKTIFVPWSRPYKTWWSVTVMAALFTVFFETYFIAFHPAGFSPYNSISAVIEYCLVAVFVIDMLVNFNLAYFDDKEGVVVYERRSIARHYLSYMFWIDLVGIFPFYLIALACAGQVGQDSHLAQGLAMFRLSRLVRLHRIKKLFHILQHNSHISFMWMTLTRNFCLAFMWSHTAACILYFIARQYDFGENTFLGVKLDVTELSAFEKYTVSLYWSIVTFATVGYGDFSAANVYEQVFVMIYILLNIIIQAWMIGSITLLIVKGDEKTGVFRDALHVLHQYSTLNQFDRKFEKGLRTQLKLEFDNREVADEQVLRYFPSSVRRKVLRKLYLPSLIRTNLMKGVREQFVDAFLATCNVEIFSPGEEILQRGSIASDLYLLVGGTVNIVPWESTKNDNTDLNASAHVGTKSVPDSDFPANTLHGQSESTLMEAGDFINEIGFFTDTPQLETIRTVTVCKTLTMSRAAYKAIAEDHPGSISKILNNLMEKVQDMAAEFEPDTPTSNTSLTKHTEVSNAGSLFDDAVDEPSYHMDVERSVKAVQSQTAVSAVQELVKMHMNKLKDDHTTRFLFAASRDDTSTITLMCQHGFDPNTADYDSRTALMVSSMKGNTAAVKTLLEFDADPNLIDMHGSSALNEATRCGNIDAMELLLKNGASLCMSESRAASTMCQTVFDSDLVMLRRLLQAGIDVNASDYDKRSPSHIAAAEGNVAALKVLVEFGADLTLRDRWQNTIDDEAKRSQSGPLLAYLESLKRNDTISFHVADVAVMEVTDDEDEEKQE